MYATGLLLVKKVVIDVRSNAVVIVTTLLCKLAIEITGKAFVTFVYRTLL